MATSQSQLEVGNILSRIETVVAERGREEFCSWLNTAGKVSEKLSFSDLWQRAGAIAFRLRRKCHVQKGQRVVLLYSPGLDFLSAFLGCLRAGVVAVPLYPPVPNMLKTGLERLQRIMSQTDAAVVLCDSTVRQLYRLDRMNVFSSTRSLWGTVQYVSTSSISVNKQFAETSIAPDDLAFLQFSSGSTGDPKGVMVSFSALSHNVMHIHLAYIKRLGLGDGFHEKERERGVSWLPHYHDMGLVVGLIRPLAFGCLMTYFSPLLFIQKPHLWIQALSRTKAHVTSTPNFGLRLAARKWSDKHGAEGIDLSSLVFIQCAAEPIQPQAVEDFITTFSRYGLRSNPLAASYGLAESVVMVCADLSGSHVVSRSRPNLVRCGFGHHSDFDIRIVHPDTFVQEADGAEGEVWVSSRSTAVGYWANKEQTQACFGAELAGQTGKKYLRTGDLGFIESGGLFISGRIKDLIILRGHNIYPQDVEAAAEHCSDMVRPGCCAAFAVKCGEGREEEGEELVVVLEVRAEAKTATLDAVCDRVARSVASQCGVSPARVVAIAEKSIPKTTSGKIRRKQTAMDLADGKLKVLLDFQAGPTQAELGHIQNPMQVVQDVVSPLASSESGGSEDLEVDEGEAVVASRMTREEIEQILLRCARAFEGLGHVEADSRLMEQGLDSVNSMNLLGSMGAALGCDLEPALLFQCPTIRAVAHHVARQGLHADGVADDPAHLAGPDLRERAPTAMAIVGMACRLPGGVNDLASLSLLQQLGMQTSGAVPWERWDRAAMGAELTRGRGCSEEVAERVSKASFVDADAFEQFDTAWFRMTTLEAATMDPQHRALLMVAAEALLDAGYSREDLAGQRIGVVVGCSGVSLFATVDDSSRSVLNGYLNYAEGPQALQGTRSALSAASGRISHTLGLKGPSVTIDTACSSSLVAMDVAKRYLASGDCEAAVVCSVNHISSPAVSLALAEARMTSRDGACKSFDSQADGYGRGEGCCAVVLRRVDAGDQAYALLIGSAVGHDGESTSLVAPNGGAQSAVIEQALYDAWVEPHQVQYLEAHGTGTSLGDPVEVAAAAEVFMCGRDDEQPLFINSIKANMGHLEACAGLAGVFAAVSVLSSGIVPPNARLHTLNPSIAGLCAAGGPQFPTCAVPLPAPVGAVACCSSFGFTGTLAHVVLQAPPPHCHRSITAPTPMVGWLFSGQDQTAVAPRALLRCDAYVAALAQCDREVKYWTGQSVLDVLHPTPTAEASNEPGASLLAQPAHFAMQVALAQAWLAAGHAPHLMVGHSLGELACLCIAGAFPLAVGVQLVCARARAVQGAASTRGCMVAVRASKDVIAGALGRASGRAAIAAVNSPEQIVVSGTAEDVDSLLRALPAGTPHKTLPSKFAYHSSAMRGAVAEYQDAIRECLPSFSQTSVPVISTVSGEEWNAAADPVQYLTEHLCGPVQFQSAFESTLRVGCRHFVEVGPRSQLEKMAKTVAVAQQTDCAIHQGTKCTARELRNWEETIRQQRLPFQLERFPLNRLQHRLLQSCSVQRDGRQLQFRGWLHEDIQAAWLGSLLSPQRFPPAAQLEGAIATAAKIRPDCTRLQLRDVTMGSVHIKSQDDRLEVDVVEGTAMEMYLVKPDSHRSLVCAASLVEKADCSQKSWSDFEARHAAAVQHIGCESRCKEQQVKPCSVSTTLTSSTATVTNLRRSALGGNLIVANLALPVTTLDDVDGDVGYMFHPIMLDAMLGVVTALSLSSELQSHRTRVEAITVCRNAEAVFRFPTEATMLVQESPNRSNWFEFCSLADGDGNLLLRLDGIAIDQESGTDEAHSNLLSLEKRWGPMDAVANSWEHQEECGCDIGRALIFGDLELSEELLANAVEVATVPALQSQVGESDLKLSTYDTIIMDCCQDLEGPEALERASRSLMQVLAVLGCVLNANLVVVFVTHGCIVDNNKPAHDKLPPGSVFGSLVWGAARSARAESGARCRVVTIDADGAKEKQEACSRAIEDLFGSRNRQDRGDLENEFVHRGRALLVSSYCHIPHDLFQERARTTSAAREGCFIVTGGMGRLGLMAARALVETRCASVLVLLSRSCRGDAKGSSDLDWLKQQDSVELRVMACDVGSDAEVAATLESIRRSGTSIKGVVHAAGVLRLGRIGHAESPGVDETLQGHVSGAWNLHRHTLKDELELFVLLSSVAAAAPVFGCSAYAAAKSFQDELARSRRHHGLPGYSMQLPWVSGSGVADGIQLPAMFLAPGAQLAPDECAKIFRRRFAAHPDSLPAVELFLPSKLLASMRSVLPPASLAQFDLPNDGQRRDSRIGSPPRPTKGFTDWMPAMNCVADERHDEDGGAWTGHEYTLHDKLEILRDVLCQPGLGLDQSLLDIGLDSLSAVEVVARLRRAGCSSISIPDVLTTQTIRQLLEQHSDSTGLQPLAAPAKVRESAPDSLVSRPAPLASLTGVPIPASWQQEQMVVLQGANPASSAYNEAILWTARRGLQVSIFEEAVRCLQQRFDALRTTFVQCDAPASSTASLFVMQLVAPSTEAPRALERKTASGAEEAGLQLSAAVRQPFDINDGALYRVCVCQIRDSAEVQIAFVFHHSIVDGWSVSLLLQDLALCYRALLNGEDPHSVLPPARAQYAEYAVWQRSHLLQPAGQTKLEDYWRGAIPRTPLLQVPTDFPRPKIPSQAQGRVQLSVGSQLAGRLRSACALQGCTLFHALLAAYALMLCTFSSTEEVLVGIPCANRSAAPGLDSVVGNLVSTLPILVRARGELADVLSAVRASVLRGVENANLPFPRIVAAVGAPRHAGRSPLVQTSFSLLARGAHDMRKGAGFKLDAVELEPLPVEVQHDAKFELELELTETNDGGLHGFVGYMHALYHAETAASFAAHYIALLEKFASAEVQADVASLAADTLRLCPRRIIALEQTGSDDSLPSAVRDARPSVTSSVCLANETLRQTHNFCAQHGCGLQSVLLAAYGLLICRTANIAQVVVEVVCETSPPSVPHLDSKLSVLVEACGSFLSVVEAVSARISAAVEAQHSRIGDERSADSSCDGYVHALFWLQDGEGAAETTVVPHGARETSLCLELHDSVAGLEGQLRGPLSEQVLRFGERFEEWVRELLAGPSVPVHTVSFLSRQDREDIATFCKDSACEFEIPFANLLDMFEASAAQYASDIALVTPAETLSYSELNLRSTRVAAALIRSGVRIGHRVGLYLERTAAMIVGALGILKAGAAYVPLNPDHPQERIQGLIDDADMNAILTVRSHRTQWVMGLDKPHVALRADGSVDSESEKSLQGSTGVTGILSAGSAPLSQLKLSSSDLMYTYYTSGSTGRPKGVNVTHGAVLHLIYAMKGELKLQRSDRVLIGSCFTFDPFVGQMWPSIEVGGSMVLSGLTEMLMDIPHMVSNFKCTWTWMTPTVLSAQSPLQLRNAGLQMITTGGEKVPLALQNRYCEHLRFLQGYGPTEAAVTVTTFECSANPAFPRRIGPPFQGLRFYVVDTVTGGLQPVAVPGELYISGPQLAQGYHNRPEETVKAFRPNPFLREDDSEDERRVFAMVYKTGDLCQWLRDGSVEYLERCDQQMKVNGVRIDPGEIEQLLRQVPGVLDAAVVHWQQRTLAAYVTPATADPKACRAHLARVLPSSMCPSVFVPIAEFSISVAGKKDLKRLPDPTPTNTAVAPLKEQQKQSQANQNSRGTIRSQLSALAQHAGATEMEDSTQWMEAGLTSMGMIRMLKGLKQSFGEDCLDLRSTAVFFEFPTLGALARKLEQGTEQQQPPAKPLPLLLADAPQASLQLEAHAKVSGSARMDQIEAIRSKLKALAQDAGAAVMDDSTQWMEAGLTSMGMIRMLKGLKREFGDDSDSGETPLEFRSTAIFFEYPSLGAMVDHLGALRDKEVVKGPVAVTNQEEVSITVEADSEVQVQAGEVLTPVFPLKNSEGSDLPFWARLLRQCIVLLVVVCSIVGATIPSIFMVERHMDRTSIWWVSGERAGPLLMAVVPVWMCTYTLLCIVAKWTLVGRYHERRVAMWSNQFTAWMIVERLWSVWELTCGRFLVTTPWLNLVYAALGANVAWSARLDVFFREWDLISVGKSAWLKGKVYGRVFDSSGVEFAAVRIGAEARIDAMAVVQPGSTLDAKTTLQAGSLVPRNSCLADGTWHGSPCRPITAGRECDDRNKEEEPLFLTRLLFPLVFLAIFIPIATSCNMLLPESNVEAEIWSLSSFRRSLLYVALYLCTGTCMFVASVALKWTFLSPYLTDMVASVVFSTFFPYLDKTLFVTWWHRAFGMAVGRNSIVIMHDFCRPSAAHQVQVGERTVVVRSTANPAEPPSLWSWLLGRSRHPWQRRGDIAIGNDVSVYLHVRLEEGAVLCDGSQCLPNTRLQAGTRLEAGETALGDPCNVLRGGPPGTDEDVFVLRMPPHLVFMHYVTLALHLATCAAIVVVGLEFMQSIVPGRHALIAVLCRITAFMIWLLVLLGAEVCIVKWLGTGRAKPGDTSIYARTDYLFTCHMDNIQKWFAALFGGLFVMDLLLFGAGFRLRVGRVFVGTPGFILQDADVVTIEDGAVLDEYSYVYGHAGMGGRLLVEDTRVARKAVLHPFAGLVLGTLGEAAALLPRSRCFGRVEIGPQEVWVGSPARPGPHAATSNGI